MRGPIIDDAARLVGDGTTLTEAGEDLLRGSLGLRTGPLRTADLIGLDNLADALRMLAERTGNSATGHASCSWPRRERAISVGKSDRGFYEYGKTFWR